MSLSDRQSTSAHLIALDVRLGVDAALPVPEVERAVHLDDRLRLGAVVAQVALERGGIRVHLRNQNSNTHRMHQEPKSA